MATGVTLKDNHANASIKIQPILEQTQKDKHSWFWK